MHVLFLIRDWVSLFCIREAGWFAPGRARPSVPHPIWCRSWLVRSLRPSGLVGRWAPRPFSQIVISTTLLALLVCTVLFTSLFVPAFLCPLAHAEQSCGRLQRSLGQLMQARALCPFSYSGPRRILAPCLPLVCWREKHQWPRHQVTLIFVVRFQCPQCSLHWRAHICTSAWPAVRRAAGMVSSRFPLRPADLAARRPSCYPPSHAVAQLRCRVLQCRSRLFVALR